MRFIYIVVLSILMVSCNNHPPRSAESTTTAVDTSAIKTGQASVQICMTCHGNNAEGNIALHAPALVNQDTWYLKQQLRNFKAGLRGDAKDSIGAQMAAIARTLPDSQAIDDIVAKIKALPASLPAKTIEGNLENGLDHYNMICGACHGPGGIGNQDLKAPKLTGINDWYLKRQLINFKSGLRGSHPDDKTGAQMKQMAATLGDEKAIDNVVAYIHSLQDKKQ